MMALSPGVARVPEPVPGDPGARGADLVDLAALDAASLEREPYVTLTVPGFVPPEALALVNAGYPEIPGPTTHPIEEVSGGPAFTALAAYLRSADFAERISRKLEIDVTGMPTMMTVRRHAEPSDGSIHTDSHTKLVTVLVYLNERWTQAGGRLRVLRSGTDIEDYAREVFPANGTLFAFRRCDWSWHGFVSCSGERRTLQMHYVDAKRLARGNLHKSSLRKRIKRLLKAWR